MFEYLRLFLPIHTLISIQHKPEVTKAAGQKIIRGMPQGYVLGPIVLCSYLGLGMFIECI